MDFNLTEEQALIQQSIKEFAQDLTGLTVKEILQRLAEIDFLGVFLPEEYGGSGGDFTSYVLVLEELAKVSASAALAYAIHNTQCSYVLYKWGSEMLKQKYLFKLCKGTKIGTYAYGEGWIGKDMLAIGTTAEKVKDGYMLNGVKTFVFNGGESDLYIVFAKTGKTLSAFALDLDTPGISFSTPYNKMGLDELRVSTMTLENVFVPNENLIGEEGHGEQIEKSVRELHSISIAAIALGISQVAMEKSIAYGKERHQFNTPIIRFEALQEMVGKMAVNISSTRLLTFRAAFSFDTNEDFGNYATMARYLAVKTGEEICLDAIQLHGGYGYSEDLGVEVLLRNLKGLSVFENLEKPLILSIAENQIA
ncbi:acyl-CoA dehydrogenase family protein [Symbiobacterium thermophilum]|uniref:Acyl-CoA dehydrogenase n=1 Tax=Symbiobacterium thermophilum TaxID=2734 RepID=A0A953I1V9_SYMTR|nr:acyl-CoA dehydrogenase family protein [Symbiobacterium thermophilum]MBY6276045.1 acyl-CoA dehydrogenase [Symbiobacterium thermophilum]